MSKNFIALCDDCTVSTFKECPKPKLSLSYTVKFVYDIKNEKWLVTHCSQYKTKKVE